jgi:hypothetical protein
MTTPSRKNSVFSQQAMKNFSVGEKRTKKGRNCPFSLVKMHQADLAWVTRSTR